MPRSLDPGYDLEKDPEYEAALARYVAQNPDSPDAGAVRALDAPARPADVAGIQVRRTPTPEPDRRAALALAIARKEDLTPFITQPGPDARPAPTTRPLDEALTELQTKPGPGVRSPPTTAAALPEGHWMRRAGGAIASGAADLAGSAGRGLARLIDDPTRHEWFDAPGSNSPAPDEPPSAPPEPAAPASSPARPVVAGKLPPVPPPSGRTAPERPLTDAQGQNIMAALRGPVRDITREASGLPPSGPPPSTPAPVQQATAPPGPPAAPGVDPLQAAERAASQNRLIAGLARAGGTAIGRGNARGYDVLDANADVPMQELGAERADAERKKGAAALAMDQDPSSPQSVMGREMADAVVPGFSAKYPRATYAEMSRGPFAKLLEMNVDLQKARIARMPKGGAGGKKALTPTQELQREKFDQSLREKASKDSEGASELSDTLDRLEGALKGKDLPGVGRVIGPLASHGVGSDAGIRMRSDLQRLADVILRARSGAAVTPSEAERLAIESGTSSGATEQQVRIATQTAIGIMRRAERNLRAKYPGATWEQLAAEGGWTPGSKTATGPAAPAQSRTIGGKRYEQDEGGQWYEVDG